MAFKWGILGAGRISHDFVTAVQTLPTKDHKVLAVAGRNKANVDKFAREHDIDRSYVGYEALAKDKDIDIVYIGNIHRQHFEVTKLMLESNKNVLCEKPFTMNEKQTRKLVAIAKAKNVFLMEAVWSRCFPAYRKIRQIIDNGEIGEVLFCSVHFGQPLQHADRLKSANLSSDAIMDLGVYTLQFQQFVFKGLKPIDIAINGHKNSAGSDESVGAILTYPNGKMAVISTSARVWLPNEGIIVGTKGTLRLPNFWCPTQLITDKETFEWPLPESKVEYLHINSAGLSFEAEEVRQCIKKGLKECPQMTLDESIELVRLMDLMRQKVGVVFPEDSQVF